MKASRLKPENHWRTVGDAVAKRAGSLADLDRVKTGKPTIDAWIVEGFEKRIRKEARRRKEMDALLKSCIRHIHALAREHGWLPLRPGEHYETLSPDVGGSG